MKWGQHRQRALASIDVPAPASMPVQALHATTLRRHEKVIQFVALVPPQVRSDYAKREIVSA